MPHKRMLVKSLEAVCAFAVSLTPALGVPPGFLRLDGADASAVAASAIGSDHLTQNIEYVAQNTTLLGNLTTQDLGSSANDVWGYASPSGREYAIVGLHDGTAFVEVTDPQNPILVGVIPDASSTWSDMRTYQEYAFNVNESNNGMQVIDLSQIDQGIVTLVREFRDNGIRTAHNVSVNNASGYAYLSGANSPSFGLVAIDISDPPNPVVAGIWTTRYVHDVYLTNYDVCPYAGRSGPCEIAFAFCGAWGMWIIDVTDKSNMQTISSMSYPQIGYCHQGWLSKDKSHIIFDDELDEQSQHFTTRMHIANVVDLANPQYEGFFSNGNTSSDHNLMTRGDYVFSANYSSGLRVVDIADLNNVQEVGFLDTFPGNDNASFNGAWGVYSGLPSGVVLVTDQSNGLFVVDTFAAAGCQADSHCNDSNDCTIDTCDASGACITSPASSGAACDDGDTCTLDGACDGAGTCLSTDVTSLACGDDVPCAPGWCDTNTGFCACVSCVVLSKPTAESTAAVVAKDRFLTIEPGNAGQMAALRVTVTDLPARFQGHIGDVYWVGAPQEVCENSGQGVNIGDPCGPAPGLPQRSFQASRLECVPTFRDWSLGGTISVYGDAVIPGGSYDIQAIGLGCYRAGLATYSTALRSATGKWGDIVDNCMGCPCGPPNGTIDVVTDVVAMVSKFQNLPCALAKVRADLEPARLDFKVNFSDVVQALGAFSGSAYPFTIPATCP